MEDLFAIFSLCVSLQLRFSLYAHHYTWWGYRLCCAPPPQEKRTKKALTWNKNSKKSPPYIGRGGGVGVGRGEERGGRVRRDLITHFKLVLLNLLLRGYAYGYIEMCLPRGEEAPSK